MTPPAKKGKSTIFSFSPFGLALILYLTLLMALGLRIVTFALGDLLLQTNPSLSIMFDAGQSAAHAAVAERLLHEDEASVEEAATEAKAALRANPFSARALSVLGEVAEGKNNEAQATILYKHANRAVLRDLTPQVWLLRREIESGNSAAVMKRIDVIFRANDARTLQPLVAALVPLVTDARFQAGFVSLLQTSTPWRKIALFEISRGTKNVPGLYAMFTALQAGNSPPDGQEMKAYLERLIKEGWIDQAYLAWSKSLPLERLEKVDYLYNAQFQYPLSYLPFDWLMPPIQGAVVDVNTENSRRVLNVDFFGGRVSFANVSHLLTLTPGPYNFTGQERSQNLLNDRGLRWRIYCLEDPNGSLVVSSALNGDQPWREFSLDFKVPEDNCRYQNLILELPAQAILETEISGSVSYANLKVQKSL